MLTKFLHSWHRASQFLLWSSACYCDTSGERVGEQGCHQPLTSAILGSSSGSWGDKVGVLNWPWTAHRTNIDSRMLLLNCSSVPPPVSCLVIDKNHPSPLCACYCRGYVCLSQHLESNNKSLALLSVAYSLFGQQGVLSTRTPGRGTRRARSTTSSWPLSRIPKIL